MSALTKGRAETRSPISALGGHQRQVHVCLVGSFSVTVPRLHRISIQLSAALKRSSRLKTCQPYHTVAIEPVSVRRLLKNGNFCSWGWRLLGDSRQSCRFLDFWRPARYAEIPVNCGYFAHKLTTILGRESARLGREGSNLRMAESKSA